MSKLKWAWTGSTKKKLILDYNPQGRRSWVDQKEAQEEQKIKYLREIKQFNRNRVK